MKLGQTLRGDLWVPKGSVSKMIRKPFEDAMSIQNIKSGFRKCGIFPFDPNAIGRGQLFRNRKIPSADVDLSLPPEDEGTNPEIMQSMSQKQLLWQLKILSLWWMNIE